ncbi:CYTH domain-containing protein [Bacillus massiliigorillae]|uniref:CYTH domain-containing protein n=1 Tax=Bacillus massiliigorillae TaxID=1243664 RepID=UPI0003AAC709|nr:CYTH domain-containing protein [Bacillus massiliigorillae]
MNQEIEIEFKNLLTKEEFIKLTNLFSIKDTEFITQENHYFDTADFSLKANGAALRIRHKNGKYVLTLKQPAEQGLLETHESLSSEEAQDILKTNQIKKGAISHILLTQFGISAEDLKHFGTLATSRAETNYMEGTLVLDHSNYLNKEDYELEYEVTDYSIGQENFMNLLKELNIPTRQTDNKIKRFYNAKFKK